MVSHTDHILCVEYKQAELDRRCAILKSAYYAVTAASPRLARIILSSRKFDVIVISALNNYDLNGLIKVAGGAEILAFDEPEAASELLKQVAERLEGRNRRQA